MFFPFKCKMQGHDVRFEIAMELFTLHYINTREALIFYINLNIIIIFMPPPNQAPRISAMWFRAT